MQVSFALEKVSAHAPPQNHGLEGITQSLRRKIFRNSSSVNLRQFQVQVSRMWTTPSPQLRITKFLAAGGVGHAFRGVLTDGIKRDVVVKWAQGVPRQRLLLREATIYSILHHLQGGMIPKMRGLYKINRDLFLVTEWMGLSIHSFGDLSADQLYVIFLGCCYHDTAYR